MDPKVPEPNHNGLAARLFAQPTTPDVRVLRCLADIYAGLSKNMMPARGIRALQRGSGTRDHSGAELAYQLADQTRIDKRERSKPGLAH
jgi:hypothetical protein